MHPVIVILNPYAGRGKGARQRVAVQTALQHAGVAYELWETDYRGHAIELAQKAAATGVEIVVAAGGDGVVNEVVNGLLRARLDYGKTAKLAVIPIGTGNDFVQEVGASMQLDQIAQAIARAKTRRIDIGWANLWEEGEASPTHRYFDNSMGAGLDAWVTLESYKIQHFEGLLLYLIAAVRGILSFVPAPLEITWHMADAAPQKRSGTIPMVSIGNGPRSGGGFYLTPDAKMDDGLFDIATVQDIGKLELLWLLPKALRGAHTKHRAVTMGRCQQLEIVAQRPVAVQLDGEVIAQRARRIEVGLLPAALEVVVA
jgi:YegS/Rv2252/BmrU family lipid kinase